VKLFPILIIDFHGIEFVLDVEKIDDESLLQTFIFFLKYDQKRHDPEQEGTPLNFEIEEPQYFISLFETEGSISQTRIEEYYQIMEVNSLS